MARFVIKTRCEDHGALEFFVPDQGGYVRLERAGRPGTLGDQICYGGDFRGSTITATPETLASEARKWWRARRRWLRNG